MEIDFSVLVDIDYRTASLRAEFEDAGIGEVVDTHSVCKVNALIIYGEIVKMVVTAEH